MPTKEVNFLAINNVPTIKKDDDIGKILCETLNSNKQSLETGDILCVASKIVSYSENRLVELASIQSSEIAKKLHEKIPRKDPRVIQLIINETGDQNGSKLQIAGNWIGGKLPNGLMLTSAGVDTINSDSAILLPQNPDKSAKKISETIERNLGVRVGIIITDSDGRADRAGATQISIGLYGLPALRIQDNGSNNKTEETTCDMIAAGAGLIMGQKGTNIPAVIVHGYDYEFDGSANLTSILHR